MIIVYQEDKIFDFDTWVPRRVTSPTNDVVSVYAGRSPVPNGACLNM